MHRHRLGGVQCRVVGLGCLNHGLPVYEGRQVQCLSVGAASRNRTDESALFLCDEVPEQREVMGVACGTVQIVDRRVGLQTTCGGSEGHCGAVGELPM